MTKELKEQNNHDQPIFLQFILIHLIKSTDFYLKPFLVVIQVYLKF